MYPNDSAAPASGGNTAAYAPALVCAAISVVLIRSGFLSFCFLIPLGYSALAYTPATAWLAFGIAASCNAVLSLGLSLYYHTGITGPGLDFLYFTVMAMGFTWIMAGGTGENGKPAFRIRTVYRFIAAAAAGALVFLGVFMGTRTDAGFSGFIQSQTEALASAYIASSDVDAVRRSFLEHWLSPERILEAVTMVVFRGGALASVFLLLFISRQAALVIARLFRRRLTPGGDLAGFHAPVHTIWVLSFCLLAILLAQVSGMQMLAIAAWNTLVVCVMLFLAQGGGIILYSLARRPLPPLVRLGFNVLVVIVIFSPVINMLALGGLVLLGIAENWLPLRAPKQNRPASTPGL